MKGQRRGVFAWVVLAVAVLLVLPQPSPSRAAGETVAVWLTTPDQSRLLQQQGSLTFGADTGSGTVIDVNEGTTYQTIDGFGAAITDSSAWLIQQRMSASQRDALMGRLFGSGGIGLSMVRLPMGASDFTVNGADYTYDDTAPDLSDFSINHDRASIIPVLKQARSLNGSLKIVGSPWSAPAWMKTSRSLNGGWLDWGSYGIYADYFVKFIQAYGAEGLPIYAVTLQNEPRHETTGYPSMRMEPGDQANFVKNNLGPAFSRAGIGAKIIVWDHNWDQADFATSVLNDAAARAYIAGSGFHCYAGDVAAQSTVRNAFPDKGIWFTECSGGQWSTDFGSNLKWQTQNLIIGATRNWAKSALLWNMALDQNYGPTNGGCADCRGVVTVNRDTGAVAYNVEYYVLGHASKFVKPGAQRIASTSNPGGIETVAFRNPDGSKALVVLNAGSGSSTIRVRWSGQSFSYSMPAGAVATFSWTNSDGGSFSPSAYYRITARHSGKSVNVKDWSTANGGLIQQWAYGGGDNEKWQLLDAGGGAYRIVSKLSGKAVDVANNSTANGASIHQWDYLSLASQQWQINALGGGYYSIINRNSGKSLDVRDVSTADGALLQQWDYTGGTNQQWQIVAVP